VSALDLMKAGDAYTHALHARDETQRAVEPARQAFEQVLLDAYKAGVDIGVIADSHPQARWVLAYALKDEAHKIDPHSRR
jgi:hypothetical protein